MKPDQFLLLTTVMNSDITYSNLVRCMHTHFHSFTSMYVRMHFEANCIYVYSYCEQQLIYKGIIKS